MAKKTTKKASKKKAAVARRGSSSDAGGTGLHADVLAEQIREAWDTNNRINLKIIDAVTPAGWAATLSKRGGRGVAGEFAHLHNLRVWQLKKRARDLADGLELIEAGSEPAVRVVRAALVRSGERVGELLEGVARGEPGRKGFRRGAFTTLSYFVSHESHHRGRVLLTLKVSGNTLDRATQSGIWAWDNI